MVTKDKYVLIDTDAGSDDALAIWMILQAHRDPNSPVNLIGIVCAHGNTQVENVAQNVIRTLLAAEEYNVPVFMGASHPLVFPFEHQDEPFHGQDGFGDVGFPPLSYKDASNFSNENGILAISRLAKEYQGKLSVLCLAPVTNMAIAARLDPSICNNLQSIYMMGGNVEGQGNVTVSAEFNFAVDPEASFILLSSFTCPIYIVPWEVSLRHATSYEWRINVLGAVDSPQAALLNAVEEKILEKYRDNWVPCDQFAAAVVINSDVITSSSNHFCTVELTGNWARGLMIVDKTGQTKKSQNATIIKGLDDDLCQNMMLWGVGGKHYLK